jgi:gamma-glutamyl:cysteine ligase YbdK (ATP-grasp superfamily)
VTKEDKILDALREISSRIQGVESAVRSVQGIVVEQGGEISDIRSHQLDDSNRMGEQVKRHVAEIIEINARLHKLDGQTPKASRQVRAGNGSSRR